MGKAADPAVDTRRVREIERRESVGFAGSGTDAEPLEQRRAYKVRRFPVRHPDAKVDVGLAEVVREELRMAVGDVEQVHVAEAGHRIERLGSATDVGVEGESRGAARRQNMQELAPVHSIYGNATDSPASQDP